MLWIERTKNGLVCPLVLEWVRFLVTEKVVDMDEEQCRGEEEIRQVD